MFLPVVLLLIGFVVLIKGADFLVSGASSVAKKYGISNLAIGLTVVAFGTSMPEMIVSLFSAVNGNSDAAFGNAIGSNNFNLLFILGLSGIIYPLMIQRNTVNYEVPFSLFAAMLLYFLVNDANRWGGPPTIDKAGILSRLDSVFLLLLFVLFLFYIYRTMRSTSPATEGEAIRIYSIPISSVMVIAGLLMLIGGGQLVVSNALDIAEQMHISQKIIGLTVLAAGTSLPELATSCVAAYRKNTDIAIGNVIGSNIFNIFLILGVTGLVHPIPYNTALNTDLQVTMAGTLLLMVFMFTMNTRKLDRWEAALMLGMYILYTSYLISLE